MKIAIGADHRGFHLKLLLQERMYKHRGQVVEWRDAGCFSAERTDYPSFAIKVAESVRAGDADVGILLCGNGVGMSIAANRYPGIYAALVWNEQVARSSKEEDNANVLVLPADYVSIDEVQGMVTAWLDAPFKEGRYRQRITMVDEIKL